ncbi:extracellular Cu/Zn superoxide dismutase [Basidiobolus meristosporus CBS 931.73]|uniref:superoxide dismutase n=1 Tax=Basidiobolus meristosporus CBS 931.73 TaxID=1314790 RepID=A0A1Y1YH44_9FUNG|nr:extracellular Cu/Zn superoxide dismutase [Basidiobolus meristosporus CBS 931.73]|eukprot:ORX97193.1 extracellular Cu/Zn superoxide dismutase [Basidiobolus meristosporus CBS 931.73]
MTNAFTKAVVILSVLTISTLTATAQEMDTDSAIAKFTAGGKGVTGTVEFIQRNEGIEIIGSVQGLPEGKHGFHIHEKGNLDDSCNAAGGHYNPFKKSHGGPDSAERHVGDLGNIEADSSGTANFTITDHIIELEGPNSIIGRALVIHEGKDDLGKGGNAASLINGDAKGRIACGIIQPNRIA